MFSKFSSLFAAIVQTIDFRTTFFVLMLVLLVLGAGAPSATGLNGG